MVSPPSEGWTKNEPAIGQAQEIVKNLFSSENQPHMDGTTQLGLTVTNL